MARVLTCIDPVPNSDGSCTETAYLEQSTVLPLLSVEDATAIATTFFLALASVMAVKVAFRKSQ
jgi:hypothetical protein